MWVIFTLACCLFGVFILLSGEPAGFDYVIGGFLLAMTYALCSIKESIDRLHP